MRSTEQLVYESGRATVGKAVEANGKRRENPEGERGHRRAKNEEER